jgi:hypothetical protein
MIFHSVYLLWVLLPLSFVVFGILGYLKRYGRRRIREHPREYFSQAVFTGVGLVIAVFIDQTVFESIIYSLTTGLIEPTIPRWLLYPAVLLLMAYLSNAFKDKQGHKKPSGHARKA